MLRLQSIVQSNIVKAKTIPIQFCGDARFCWRNCIQLVQLITGYIRNNIRNHDKTIVNNCTDLIPLNFEGKKILHSRCNLEAACVDSPVLLYYYLHLTFTLNIFCDPSSSKKCKIFLMKFYWEKLVLLMQTLLKKSFVYVEKYLRETDCSMDRLHHFVNVHLNWTLRPGASYTKVFPNRNIGNRFQKFR